MTMTNTHTIDNIQDEEAFLLQQLLDARHKLKLHKEESSARKFTQNKLEKDLEIVEQALIDYMANNGLNQFEAGHCKVTFGESESIDAPDIDAIPEMFVRTKVTKEPNKILIKELRPEGNWYNIVKSNKITVTEA